MVNRALWSAIGLLMVVVGTAGAACNKSESASAAPSAPMSGSDHSGHVTKVAVSEKGFVPSSVSATKGEPLVLEFTRTTDVTCATKVAFPELNLTKDLPLNVPVQVPVPTDQARRLTFQCGMGMYKSSVVIN